MSLATALSFVKSRATSMSGMRYRASSTARARPIPLEAPVMSAYPVLLSAAAAEVVELAACNSSSVSCV
eukprot:CAMPEP_0201985010 /NCGR_PEP_ID=MMETSP0904-20121228/85524_1 /ASSEMBLY_ACC=CAM_ASM_000553 /TAXON_ID=420261 /ORGANISM="Thalassiosira antarctica, Strain CCMP982" /LENGTH=68 /DNA_ID=CAMNT_0048538551 /DNA_START=98 /DNA_END=300 /DNA_ORIENTATION=+